MNLHGGVCGCVCVKKLFQIDWHLVCEFFCFQALSGSRSKTAHEFPIWVALEPASYGWLSNEDCTALSKPFLGSGCRQHVHWGNWGGRAQRGVVSLLQSTDCHGVTMTGKQTKMTNHAGTDSCVNFIPVFKYLFLYTQFHLFIFHLHLCKKEKWKGYKLFLKMR